MDFFDAAAHRVSLSNPLSTQKACHSRFGMADDPSFRINGHDVDTARLGIINVIFHSCS
jgi:hypothetical protein